MKAKANKANVHNVTKKERDMLLKRMGDTAFRTEAGTVAATRIAGARKLKTTS